MFDPPYGVILASLAAAGIIVLAARRPATRRWIAAGLVAGAGLVIAFYLVIIGALAQMDTGGGVPPLIWVLAILAVVAGLVGAVLILRRRVPPGA